MTDLPIHAYDSLSSESIRRVLNIGEDEPLVFCHEHGIWSADPCPACQTPWTDSPTGIPCLNCAHCSHANNPFGQCPHTCEEVCHPGQECLPMAGEGHHV